MLPRATESRTQREAGRGTLDMDRKVVAKSLFAEVSSATVEE
jgi:hypothetical protein